MSVEQEGPQNIEAFWVLWQRIPCFSDLSINYQQEKISWSTCSWLAFI